jgi:hypothetical protein
MNGAAVFIGHDVHMNGDLDTLCHMRIAHYINKAEEIVEKRIADNLTGEKKVIRSLLRIPQT